MSTTALEAIFASLLIDAHEGRALQTFDVAEEYLHESPPNDKVLQMNFKGKFVDIMSEINLEYENCVIYEKGKRYGMI